MSRSYHAVTHHTLTGEIEIETDRGRQRVRGHRYHLKKFSPCRVWDKSECVGGEKAWQILWNRKGKMCQAASQRGKKSKGMFVILKSTCITKKSTSGQQEALTRSWYQRKEGGPGASFSHRSAQTPLLFIKQMVSGWENIIRAPGNMSKGKGQG